MESQKAGPSLYPSMTIRRDGCCAYAQKRDLIETHSELITKSLSFILYLTVWLTSLVLFSPHILFLNRPFQRVQVGLQLGFYLPQLPNYCFRSSDCICFPFLIFLYYLYLELPLFFSSSLFFSIYLFSFPLFIP